MKIEDLIKGKWYVKNNDFSIAGAFKFEKLSGNNHACYSERIWSLGIYHNDDGSVSWYDSQISEISLDEIQKYLPKGHPDLLNETTNIPEYVEYIDTKYKGKIVKVEEWTSHSFCCIRFENGQREQPFKHLVKSSTKEAYELQNKPKEIMFRKGEYIVTLEGQFNNTDCGKQNYCFKVREDGDYLRPCLDLDGNTRNGNSNIRFDKSRTDCTDWRYSTAKEAEHYEKIGKPYDVSTLVSKSAVKEWGVGTYAVAIVDGTAISKTNDKYYVGDVHKITHFFNDGTCGLAFSTNCCKKRDFKWFATESEAKEFSKTLVKSQESYKYEVVHCKTQEEWDFVKKHLNGINDCNWMGSYNKESGHCFNLKTPNHSNLEFYQSENSKIYNFQEWCSKFGHDPIVDGIKENYESVFPKLEMENRAKVLITGTEGEITTKNMEEMFYNSNISDVDRAKRDYPVGTKYICPLLFKEHIVEENTIDNGLTIKSGSDFDIDWNIYRETDKGIDGGEMKGWFKYNGKWAEIISTPEKVVTYTGASIEKANETKPTINLLDGVESLMFLKYGITPIDYSTVGVDFDLETGEFSYEYPQFNKRNRQQQITEQIIEVKQLKPITIK